MNMNTIVFRRAKAAWQNELVDRLGRCDAAFTPAAVGVPFGELFDVRFSQWRGHWRVDVSPKRPEFTPSVVDTEALRTALDRVEASGWTSGEGDGGGDSVWISGSLGRRRVTLNLTVGATE